MPVLDNALPRSAGVFAPILLGLRFGRPVFEGSRALTSLIPRTNYLVDIGLDWVRQRPGPSVAVLEGLLLGETAPPSRASARQIEQPALIVGHPSDPLHPFSDSGMLAEELPERAAGRRQLDPRVAAQARSGSTTSWRTSSTASGRRPSDASRVDRKPADGAGRAERSSQARPMANRKEEKERLREIRGWRRRSARPPSSGAS